MVRGALFDRYVVVDWSANSTPKLGRDSIWTCVFEPRTGHRAVVNHPTRCAARRHLTDVLIGAPHSVLVGYDFPLGYPAGFARLAGFAGTPAWLATWRHLCASVDDRADNSNNRFEVAARINSMISSGRGPFWGTTAERHVRLELSRTKAPGFPHAGIDEYRVSEIALGRGGRRPASVWQLAGAGSVGSQALVGIPVVQSLRWHPRLAHRSVVWPFETGLLAPPGAGHSRRIVHAEVWPSSIPFDPARHPVKDAAQVIGLCDHLAALDGAGQLAELFAPELDRETARVVIDEEGWILGAGSSHPWIEPVPVCSEAMSAASRPARHP